MNGLLNCRLHSGQVRSNPANLFLLILVTFLTAGFGFAQMPPLLPCQEETPTFMGSPEPTLCEQYSNFSCEIQIGGGTQFPKSSLLGTASLSGNVCIVGDFEVDVPLTFVDTIVKINPGVTIAIAPSPNGYDVGSSLGINNSKLFACSGLWKGITLGPLSSVGTWNNSVIEDAETAIFASAFCALSVQQTTFNRNRVGIELFTPFPNIGVPGPVMWVFTGNQFTCTAPLNGTANEITQVGVKLRDADLYPFFANGNNSFRGLIRGIVAESSGSNAFAFCNVFANNYNFISIRDKGIDFKGRRLYVRNSTFEYIAKHGIYFHESSFLNLKNNKFYIRELTTPMVFRYMVQIKDPKADNNLNISDNYFYTEGQLFNWVVWGIHMTSGGNSTFRAAINHNVFDLYNASFEISGHPSRAIQIEGNISSDSDIDIEANEFNVNPFILNHSRGIAAIYGTKHNIHVIGNHFTGGGTHIEFWGSPNGGANDISDNTIDPSSDFGTGMFVHDFPNTTICSNTNNGASNVGYLLWGQNQGTTFSGNDTRGCWQHAFWITGDQPVIGQQIHNGNEWYPAIVFNNGFYYYVRPRLEHMDPTVVEMSKFKVHTPQSIWSGSHYTYFSEYHPATDQLIPDVNDEFFEQTDGTPTVNCISQLTEPDEVDVQIASGGFEANVTNQGSVFDAKRFLYKKLMENPAYQSAHSSFAAFLFAEQNSSVGKFYRLEKAIDDAHRLNANDKAALDNLQTQCEAIDQSMAQQGATQSQLLGYIAQRKSLDSIAYAILAQHEVNKTAVLSNAVLIWQSISPQNVFEQYRKDVLGIYLTAQTQQDGLLTEGQVEELQDIAKLCSEVGGSAVYLAQGFLPECDRAEIMAPIEQCHEVPEYQERNNALSNHIRISEDAQVQVSPNPARDWVNIVSVRQMAGRAELYSLTGQLMATTPISFGDNRLRFDLHSGVYILRVVYDNGDASSHKLIVNK